MKRNGEAPLSEPRKTRRASLIESEKKVSTKAQMKRITDSTENSGVVVKPVKPSITEVNSPAKQRLSAAAWAAAEFAEKPRRGKSPGRAKAVEETPATIKKTRKSNAIFDAEVLQKTLEGINQSSPPMSNTRTLRPRRPLETEAGSPIAMTPLSRSKAVEETEVTTIVVPKHTTKGILAKLILAVHIVAGISLYVHHTIARIPTIWSCPTEAYISIAVIACLHFYKSF